VTVKRRPRARAGRARGNFKLDGLRNIGFFRVQCQWVVGTLRSMGSESAKDVP
jgi:hypothetical protein